MVLLMSLEELKRKNWVLKNEKITLQRHNEHLEQRLSEFVTWSQQAQKIVEENKIRITQLERENQYYYSKVNQGTVAMSQNLLDENSTTKRKLQEMEEQFENFNALINPLIMQNVTNFDQSLKKKVILALNKGNDEKKILAVFVEDPEKIYSIDYILKQTGINRLEVNTILKKFSYYDFIRETKRNEYQTIQAIGDKVVSNKDLKRVTLESLQKHFIHEISTSMDSNIHVQLIDDFCNELSRRGEKNLLKLVTELKGDLRMARRSSDWISDKLTDFTSAGASQPDLVNSYSSSGPISSSSANKELFDEIDTKDWKKLSNTDIIEKVKLHITEKTGVNQVISTLNQLRDHLEVTVAGGRVLYNITAMINQIKKDELFDKDEIHETLYELSFKV